MDVSVAAPFPFHEEFIPIPPIIHQDSSEKLTEPAILMRLVDDISGHVGALLSVREILLVYHLSKRALNDFLAVTSALGVTKRLTSDTFCFQRKGLSRELQMKLTHEIETASKRASVPEIFSFQDVPPIGELAIRFIKLFLFLRKDAIDIRQAAKLMSTKSAKYKTVLRKLYLVTTSLEASGILEKMRNLSEVRFIHNDWTAPDRLTVFGMLVDEQTRVDQLYAKRRRTFEQQTSL